MSWPVPVTPEASQTLRGDHVEKQLLQGGGHRLQFIDKPGKFPIPGTSRAQSWRITATGRREGRVRAADGRGIQEHWKQGKDLEPRRVSEGSECRVKGQGLTASSRVSCSAKWSARNTRTSVGSAGESPGRARGLGRSGARGSTRARRFRMRSALPPPTPSRAAYPVRSKKLSSRSS